MPRVAVAEAGSMSVRLEVLEPLPSLSRSHTKVRHEIRLGEEVFSRGALSRRTIARVVDAFHGFRETAERYGAHHTVGVATSALRSARNGREVCERVTDETGIPLRIIDGREEAQLIRKSVQKAMRIEHHRALMVDIGGGSVETSLIDSGQIVHEASSENGALRLLQILKGRDGERRLNETIEAWCREQVPHFVPRSGKQPQLDLFVATGGSPRALAELRGTILGKKQTDRLIASELAEILDVLTPLSLEARQKRFGLKADRADVIVPAGKLLHAFMTSIGAERVFIPEVRLRHAVAQSVVG